MVGSSYGVDKAVLYRKSLHTVKYQVFFTIQFVELQIGEVMKVMEKDRVDADIEKSGVRVVERSTAVCTALCKIHSLW